MLHTLICERQAGKYIHLAQKKRLVQAWWQTRELLGGLLCLQLSIVSLEFGRVEGVTRFQAIASRLEAIASINNGLFAPALAPFAGFPVHLTGSRPQ